jgi:hypothetical protein
MTGIVLSAIHGHHPLGFLAACGALRVATERLPDCALSWSQTESDNLWMPCLHCGLSSHDELESRLVNGVADAAKCYLTCLDKYKITEAEATLDQFRSSSLRALPFIASKRQAEIAAGLLPSIGSDLVSRQKETGKKKKTVIQTTHFVMTSGQQDLVSGMRKAATRLAKHSKNGNVPAEIQEMIKEALFGPWQYRDDEHSLGWDPQGQRLHALRNKAPTNDAKKRSVCAAVFLATQALPLFPCFAVRSRLRTTAFHRDKNGDDWFAWPMWREPISLSTLRSLLAHPVNRDLHRRGVRMVYRCRRVPTGGAEGNYQIFSNSEEYILP